MLLDGLWTVHALLALSSFVLGNPAINDPLAAPRVFISFKGKILKLILCSLLSYSHLPLFSGLQLVF